VVGALQVGEQAMVVGVMGFCDSNQKPQSIARKASAAQSFLVSLSISVLRQKEVRRTCVEALTKLQQPLQHGLFLNWSKRDS
jgi:hypothetical protein